MSVRKVPGENEGSLEGNHDNPCERHPPGTVILRTSVEKCADTYQKKHPKGRALEAGGKNSLVKLLHMKAT